jgi:TrwC relaxase
VVADVAKLSVGREAYYTRELATDHQQYLSGHGESPGRWYGAGATNLGLQGEASPAGFQAMFEGREPQPRPRFLRGPTVASERLGRSGRRARCGGQEGLVQLRAGADLELAIGAAQVELDRLDRDEERLRDLLVAHAACCELCHASLAGGERVEPRLEDLPRPGTGGGDLVVRPPGEPEGAAP